VEILFFRIKYEVDTWKTDKDDTFILIYLTYLIYLTNEKL